MSQCNHRLSRLQHSCCHLALQHGLTAAAAAPVHWSIEGCHHQAVAPHLLLKPAEEGEEKEKGREEEEAGQSQRQQQQLKSTRASVSAAGTI
jgi:uncharacterized membrane protein